MLPQQLSNEAIVALCGVVLGGLQIVNLIVVATLHRCLDAHRQDVQRMHWQNIRFFKTMHRQNVNRLDNIERLEVEKKEQ